MSSDINRSTVIGRLVKSPELRYTQGGHPVASFTLASNRSYMVGNDRKDQPSFIPCVAWGKIGETIAKHCTKGMRIGIEGRLQSRSWDDRDGKKHFALEVIVQGFQFLTYPKGSQGSDAVEHDDTHTDKPDIMDGDEVRDADNFDELPEW